MVMEEEVVEIHSSTAAKISFFLTSHGDARSAWNMTARDIPAEAIAWARAESAISW